MKHDVKCSQKPYAFHGRVVVSVALLMAFAFALFAAPTTAAADTREPVLAFKKIDASQDGVISANLTWTGDPQAFRSSQMQVNGEPVDADVTPLGNNTQQSIAYIVDTSQLAADSGTLSITKVWLKNWLEGLSVTQRQNQPIAIYAAGTTPVLLQDYTIDTQKLLNAVDRLGPGLGSASWDPLNQRSALWQTTQQAADRLSSYQIDQRNIVVVSAAGNTVASDSTAPAAGSVKASGATYYSIIGPDATASGRMDELGSVTGGATISILDTSELAPALNKVSGVITGGQYRVLINENVEEPTATLSITINEEKASGTVSTGSVVAGTAQLSVPVSEAAPQGLLSNKIVLLIGLLLIATAIAFVVYVIGNSVFNTYSFSDQIASYNRFRESFNNGEAEEEVEQSRFGATKSFIVQRAIEATEKIAEERGFLNRAETALERANLSIKPAEFIVLYAAIVIFAPIVGFVLGGILFFLAFGALAIVAPLALLSNLANRRRRKFMEQLPDALHLLAGSLRAGYSLMQGVEAVSEETPEPIAQELRRVITETRLGGDLIESLDKVSLRMNSQDFAWIVMGISIQAEVGGDLAELLDSVGETMVQRERLRREIKALTAEGRISAIVLIFLPIVLLVILNFMNPEYGSSLFTSTLGQMMLAGGAVSLIIGWLWMKKIVDVKV